MRKWVTPVWARLSPVAVRSRRPKLGMVGLGRDRRQVLGVPWPGRSGLQGLSSGSRSQ